MEYENLDFPKKIQKLKHTTMKNMASKILKKKWIQYFQTNQTVVQSKFPSKTNKDIQAIFDINHEYDPQHCTRIQSSYYTENNVNRT